MPPTVLLADDDPGTRETAGLLLRHSGINVHEASTGERAIALGRALALDLALLDLRLPDMTGLDVARALRAEGRTVP